MNRGVDPWIYYTLRYYKIGPFWGPPRALGLLRPTKPSQNQLTYTFQHQPDTCQPFPWQHKMFPSSGIFSQFQGNCFHVFPGHFSAPTDLPSRLFLPMRSTLTSPRPRIMTSRLSWRQLGDNFPLLRYSKIGPFLGSPRALGP